MKLSEAIRKGAAIRPQVHGAYVGLVGDDETGTCAIGAAYEAAMGKLPDQSFINFTELNQHLDRATPGGIIQDIYELNDKKLWSREQIADWLEAEGY